MRFKRIFLLVLDSLGVGEASDANNYGDVGSSTLGHIKENYDLFVPNLKKLGFLNTVNMDENNDVDAYYTIAKPTNLGKDTMAGHYEMMGVRNLFPFKTFNEKGFPKELIDQIELVTNRRVIGNKVCDSEEIINELGERQVNYGSLIVYTSSDSNLQVAAHEEVIPPTQLYQYCEKIRKLTFHEAWRVGRVIARPFTGRTINSGGNKFRFTADRKDYAVKPPQSSVLDRLKEKGYQVIGIGKINDIFDGEGITKVMKADNNIEGINKFSSVMDKNFTGLCYCNLSDFDSEYGHRRDVVGYAKAIEELDVEIPLMLNKLGTEDLLIITADHGNDPTFKGNDHTRENVPVILFSRNFKNPSRMEPLDTFASIGATIAENFSVETPSFGTSVLDKLI